MEGLYLVTDRELCGGRSIEWVVSRAVSGGVRYVQLREKDTSTRAFIDLAKRVNEILLPLDIPLIINDRVDVALAAGADGVHVGQDDMPYHEARKLLGAKKIIGITAHNAEEAVAAEKLGADYIGASPIFETKTKKDAGRQAGLQLIRDIKKSVRIPVVAIGGINLENITSVMQAGADSAAAISVVVTKDDVAEECRKFVEIISNFKQPHTCR